MSKVKESLYTRERSYTKYTVERLGFEVWTCCLTTSEDKSVLLFFTATLKGRDRGREVQTLQIFFGKLLREVMGKPQC